MKNIRQSAGDSRQLEFASKLCQHVMRAHNCSLRIANDLQRIVTVPPPPIVGALTAFLGRPAPDLPWTVS